MTEAELRQLFKNKSNCYADTSDDSVVLAMDEDRFVEVVKEYLLSIKSKIELREGDGVVLRMVDLNMSRFTNQQQIDGKIKGY